MTHENQGAAAVEHVLDRRQGLDDPVIAGDVAVVVLRHVEINAHQDLLALDVDIRNCLLGHKLLLVVWSSAFRRARPVLPAFNAKLRTSPDPQLLQLGDPFDQVHAPAGIAPLVVVPHGDFDHVAVEDDRVVGIENRAGRVADDVRGDDGIGHVLDNALHGAFGGLFHEAIDLFDAGLAGGHEGQVRDRAVGHRNAEGVAVQLALEGRDDLAQGLGGAGGRGDGAQGGGAAATLILVGHIQDRLVVRIGVYGGHEAFDDADLLMQNLAGGGQRVRGARGVRDALHRRLQLAVVDAQHDGGVRLILGRGGQQHALGAGRDVRIVAGLAVGGAGGEPAGGLQHDIHAHLAPRQLGRVFLVEDRDLFAVDDDGGSLDLDLAREFALGRVVLEHIGQHIGVEQIVDGCDLELARLLHHHRANDEPADAAETVNSNLRCHE